VPSARVVPAFDPVKDRRPGFGLGVEPSAVEQLTFEGGEEALGHRIVVAVAHRPHRGADADLLAAAPEADRGILAALVGVMDHRGRPALPNGHVERVEHELGLQMGGHRPAHDPAAADIEDDREIEESGPGGDVGDIRDPELVGALGPEGPLDQIGRRRGGGIAAGTAPAQRVSTMQAGDTLEVLEMPRINLAILSWRVRNAGSRPEVLTWNLPYEMIVVGAYWQ